MNPDGTASPASSSKVRNMTLAPSTYVVRYTIYNIQQYTKTTSLSENNTGSDTKAVSTRKNSTLVTEWPTRSLPFSSPEPWKQMQTRGPNQFINQELILVAESDENRNLHLVHLHHAEQDFHSELENTSGFDVECRHLLYTYVRLNLFKWRLSMRQIHRNPF